MTYAAVSIPEFLTYYQEDKNNFKEDLNNKNYENGLVFITDSISLFLGEFLNNINEYDGNISIKSVYKAIKKYVLSMFQIANKSEKTDYYSFIEYISLVEYSKDNKGKIIAELIDIDDRYIINEPDVENIRIIANGIFEQYLNKEDNLEKFNSNNKLYVFVIAYDVWLADQPISVFIIDNE